MSQLIDIQWGGTSQMKAELLVLSLAVQHGDYDYYHLISGQDLPLKSQDFIHKYFDEEVKDKICINFQERNNLGYVFNYNLGYFHLFTDYLRRKNPIIRKAASGLRHLFIKLQQAVGYRRDWDGYILAKGTNWMSSNKEFAQYLSHNRSKIIKKFRGVLGPDEIYKHTIALSSDFKDSLFHSSSVSDSLRHIDWNRGLPYVWRKEDFDELMSCNELFARKFSSEVDKDIIDLIYSRLKTNE